MPSWRDLKVPPARPGVSPSTTMVAARIARVGHELVRIAGLAALAVRAAAASRSPGRRTACGAPAWRAPPAGPGRADVHRLRRLGGAERVLLLGVHQLGEDALGGAAGHGGRLVRAERVEEVDEEVADRLVGRHELERRARALHARCAGPSARAACSGCRRGPRRPRTGPRGPRRAEASARNAGTPAWSASFTSGSVRGSCAAAGWRSRDTAAKRARNGVCTWNDSVAAWSVGGVSSIVSRSACGSRPIAAKVVAILPNQRACTRATGAACGRRRPEAREEVAQLGLRVGEVAHHRQQVARERLELADRRVDRGAATGDRVAEALERLAGIRARLGREAREHVLELGRVRRRVLDRDRVAVLERLLCAAGDQLHVLEAERGARAHRQGRVHRQRLDRLVELEVEDRDRPAPRRSRSPGRS